MKPYLEHVAEPQDASWVLFDRRLTSIPFEWHYNSEYELTLTLNSRGQRFIGDSVSCYDHGDLVLIGPKIPHTWCSTQDVEAGRHHQALVLWFTDSFVKGMVAPHIEFHPVLKLLQKSSRALTFSETVRKKAQSIICEMPAQAAGDRTLGLIKVLLLLASDKRASFVTSVANQSESFALPTEERIGRVISYLHSHYLDEISISKLTQVAALSRSSLHRLFKLQTRMTISAYLAQLRIGNACALLLNTDKPIALVSEEVGYGNLAHFNRQFKAFKGQTPREFRGNFDLTSDQKKIKRVGDVVF